MRIAAVAAIGLLACAPHSVEARPFRVTSIEPAVVEALDIESIRKGPAGTSTAAITDILRPGAGGQAPNPAARVTIFEFQCPTGYFRSLATLSLAPDMTRLDTATAYGPWVIAGPAQEEAQKVICADQIDPKLNVEAPNVKALVNAIQQAIH